MRSFFHLITMKIILSKNISDIFEKATQIPTISVAPFEDLDAPVNMHPDMLFFVIDKTVFCYNKYYLNNESLFDKIKKEGYDIVRVKKECKREYPNDISLNVLKMGKTLFGKKTHVAPEILKYAEKNGYSFINVNQGYASCATLVLNDDNAITADVSLKKAIENVGKKALLISGGGISLPGYNCGFTGGASVVIDKNVYFFGDVNFLQDYEIIDEKITSLNMKTFSITTGGVYDFGGAKLI